MISTLVPAPAIAAAIAAIVMVPFLLILLQWGPAAVRRPGRRFLAASALAAAGWVASLAMLSWHWVEALAGLLLCISALYVGFMVWSVLAWGFTLHLLLGLAKADKPLAQSDWVAGYLGPQGADRLGRDRLAMLGARGFVTPEVPAPAEGGPRVRLNRSRAWPMLSGTRLVAWFFGVRLP